MNHHTQRSRRRRGPYWWRGRCSCSWLLPYRFSTANDGLGIHYGSTKKSGIAFLQERVINYLFLRLLPGCSVSGLHSVSRIFQSSLARFPFDKQFSPCSWVEFDFYGRRRAKPKGHIMSVLCLLRVDLCLSTRSGGYLTIVNSGNYSIWRTTYWWQECLRPTFS